MDDDEWAAHAGSWDDTAAVRAYAAAAYASLTTILAEYGIPIAEAHICDFGCGTGLMTERLVDDRATVDAVDTSPAMLEVLRDKSVRLPLPGVRMLGELPASTPVYDVVVCSSVCSFLDDYPAAVDDLVGRLRPGGVFLQWDWERPAGAVDAHGLTRNEVEATLTAAGLSNVTVGTGFEIVVEDQVMRPLVGHGRRAAAA